MNRLNDEAQRYRLTSASESRPSRSATWRESGVSITTVSRILNKRASGVPIRDTTRQRVEETATRLGYQPNLLARSLRGQRSTIIGVIARDISDPFHTQILKCINARAQERACSSASHPDEVTCPPWFVHLAFLTVSQLRDLSAACHSPIGLNA